MNRTKIYVSFAPEDKKEGTTLGDQCRNPFSTFDVIGGSEEGQGNESWETQTRVWEIKVAREAGIPVLGVFANKEYQESVPETFGSGPVIEWNWEYVYNTILSIVK
jgi:hypothetical protein